MIKQKGKVFGLAALSMLMIVGCQTVDVDSSSSSSIPATTDSSRSESASSSSLISSVTSSSSGSTSSSSPSLPPQPGIDIEKEKQKIVNLLNRAKATNNYTYGFLSDNASLVGAKIITDSYLADADGATASVALPSFEKEDETILYSIEKQEDGYRLLNALSYTEDGVSHPYHSTSELNYLRLLDYGGNTFDETNLTYQSGYFIVDDRDAITVFASMFNLGNYVSNIKRVFLNPVIDGELHIGFASNFTDSGDITDMLDSTIGVIRDVENSAQEEVENYVEDFVLPEEYLVEDNLPKLTNGVLSYQAKVTRFENESIESVLSDKIFTCDLENDRAEIYNQLAEDKTYLEKDETGEAIEKYITPSNVVESVDTDALYKDLVPSLTDTLDLKAFRKVGENTYRYFGYQAESIAETLTGYTDGMGLIINMEATLDSDGTIESIKAYSWTTYVGNVSYRYEMEVTFSGQDEVNEISSFTGDPDPRIESALSRFDSTTGYSISTFNISNPDVTTTYTARDNILLIDELVPDTAAGSDHSYIHSYSGYVLQDGGIAPFVVGDDMVATLKDVPEGDYDSIDQLLGFTSISPLVFSLNEDETTLTVKPLVKGFEDLIPTGPNGEFMKDETLKFSFDAESSTITGYSYRNTVTTDDEAVITYGVDLPSDIDFSNIREETFQAPTSWAEAHPDIYEAISTNKFMSGHEDELPFLYDSTIDDCWEVGSSGITEMRIINNYSLTGCPEFEAYQEEYIALLQESGFDTTKIQGGNTYYIDEDLPFAVTIVGASSSTLDIIIRNRSMYGL